MAVAVEDVRELGDPVVTKVRGQDEALDLPGREVPHRDLLVSQDDVLVVEENCLAVASLSKVKLDGVGFEALRPIETVEGILSRAPRGPTVPNDPNGV
jgi:hypothetical protein